MMHTNPISIRLLSNEDLPLVQELVLAIQQKEFNLNIGLTEQPDLQSVHHFKNSKLWEAYIQGQLVGTIGLISFGQDAAALRKMFVKKSFRGKSYGIAALLLEHLQQHAKSSGIHNLYLGTVSILEAAISFYKKNGFSLINETSLPALFPKMDSDDTFFHKTL